MRVTRTRTKDQFDAYKGQFYQSKGFLYTYPELSLSKLHRAYRATTSYLVTIRLAHLHPAQNECKPIISIGTIMSHLQSTNIPTSVIQGTFSETV